MSLNNYILDIDLDAAVANCHGSTLGQQSLVLQDLDKIFSLLQKGQGSRRWFMDEHCHALNIWRDMAISSAEVWHIDAHHDCYGATDHRVWRIGPRQACQHGSAITSATFLLAAWRMQIVKHVYWAIPSWLDENSASKALQSEMGPSWRHISIVRLEDVPELPWKCVTTAWSRRWIDKQLHLQVAKVVPESAVSAVMTGTTCIAY